MSTFKTLTLAVLFGCFHATTASASGFFYDCDLTQQGRSGGWVTPKVAIIVEGNGQVSALDGIAIRFFDGKAHKARVTKNTDKTMVVRWTLKGFRNSSNQITTHFDYTATINKKSGKVSIYAKPDGYNNRFSAKGACVVKDK